MVKEIVVISGKGGTGKTSIVASLAQLLPNKVLADCDVDAADLHLILNPRLMEEREFWCGKSAYISSDLCNQCGKCLNLCRFNAISNNFSVDKVSCEGCGVCAYFCPTKAIEMIENLAGHWYISETEIGPMIHARLGTAEENSGKLVSIVRGQAKKIAAQNNHELILVDGPPGIGCPVIASITGSDLVIVVTEPTLSGIHDLGRVISLTEHFNIETLVCINKADLNPDISLQLIEKCSLLGIEVIGKIPYDETITQAQIKGVSVVEFASHSPGSLELNKMARKILHELTKRSDNLL